MIMHGKFGEYKCEWSSVGWTYAQVILYQKRSKFFGLCEGWVKVSDGRFGMSEQELNVRRMLPHQFIAWYRGAIDQYEKYVEEWNKFYDQKPFTAKEIVESQS